MSPEKISDFKPGTDWHDYVITWAPTYVEWQVNGEVVRRQEGTPDVAFLTDAQHLFMNFWTPTFAGWGDDFDPTNMPFYAQYDYVKVEKYNEDTGNFVFHWQDDFDFFDESKWRKSNGWGSGTHTSSIYYPSQVYIENGRLVFKMEPDKDGDGKPDENDDKPDDGDKDDEVEPDEETEEDTEDEEEEDEEDDEKSDDD